MSNVLFACDLDNTIIYSRKHPHDGWPCVEWINGEEQAYASPKTISLLPEVMQRTLLVPVTSRSMEQYGRLRLPASFKMALTANGADLLLEGVPESGWRQETDAMLFPWRDEIVRCYDMLVKSDHYIRCRIVDDAYLFVYCEANTNPITEASSLQACTQLKVIAAGKKIYLLPPPLNKGTALARLLKRSAAKRCIAAGDGDMDIPMLQYADQAIILPWMTSLLHRGALICPRERVFSEFVFETILELCD